MKVILQKDLYERSLSVFSKAVKKHAIEFLLTDVLDEADMLAHHHAGSNCFIIRQHLFNRNFSLTKML